MDAHRGSEQGMAALELGLVLPLVALLLLVLVEGASALRTYSALQEASREAARMAVREGQDADLKALVESLFPDLPRDSLQVVTSTDPAARTVTVKVSHAYQTFAGTSGSQDVFGNDPFVFEAATCMPLP